LKNYYKILGVAYDADPNVIEVVFNNHYQLHQRGVHNYTDEKFNEIEEAYEILSDTPSKKSYDTALAMSLPGGKLTTDLPIARINEDSNDSFNRLLFFGGIALLLTFAKTFNNESHRAMKFDESASFLKKYEKTSIFPQRCNTNDSLLFKQFSLDR
jgi:DnaJ-class molecular chaperone